MERKRPNYRMSRAVRSAVCILSLVLLCAVAAFSDWLHRIPLAHNVLAPNFRTSAPVNEYTVVPGRKFAFLASCNRGTGKAVLNYALHFKRVWHIETLHICLGTSSNPQLIDQLRDYFGIQNVITLSPSVLATSGPSAHWPNASTIDQILEAHRVTDLYIAKAGNPIDGVWSLLPGVRNLIHAVFDATAPHGDAFAKISKEVPGNGVPIVPRMIRPSTRHGSTLRWSLNIPTDATVFCRHGGSTTFSIRMAHIAVGSVAASNPSTYFLFLNTSPFCCSNLSNVIHLSESVDEEYLGRFIRSCDAMVHARADGETFGQAIGEFAVTNKPVFTYGRPPHGASAHLERLGDKAQIYTSAEELITKLVTFNRTVAAALDWHTAYDECTPTAVMKSFWHTFVSLDSFSEYSPRWNIRTFHWKFPIKTAAQNAKKKKK